MSRPYSSDEICDLAQKHLDSVLKELPEIVGHTMLLVQLVTWLEMHADDRECPARLRVFIETAKPVLAEMLFACEAGPYGGWSVN